MREKSSYATHSRSLLLPSSLLMGYYLYASYILIFKSLCRKRIHCMWHVNEVEICFAKMGFLDSKWSNLNTPWSYTICSHSLLLFILECPFPLHAGKWRCCMWHVKNVEIHFAKIGFVDCKWPNLNAPGCHSLLVSIVVSGVSFSYACGTPAPAFPFCFLSRDQHF